MLHVILLSFASKFKCYNALVPVRKTMKSPKKTKTLDSDLSLPPVHAKTIQNLEREAANTQTLYERVFQEDSATALFIRRRAIDLAPVDLDEREEIAKLALQAVELKTNQALINGLNTRLGGVSPKLPKKSATSPVTDLPLPPSL
jgi:hypothetical protein